MLAACQAGIDSMFPKEQRPIPPELVKKMKAKGMTEASPILLRIFKSENELEVWKQTNTGRYDLLETYEICKWSGELGPKFKEGDRQAPEGFYTVNPWQMNPQSEYHLSFNIGFPNTFDRAHGRTGSHLMVHGACSSAGCYSMTDELVEEIYALAREAFEGGQKAFQVQAFPFRMTPENMAKNADSPHFEFWTMLKEGHDHFELTRYPVKVDVCEKRYVFNRLPAEEGDGFSPSDECPQTTMPASLLMSYSALREEHNEAFQQALRVQTTRAKRRGDPLGEIDPSSLTLVARGSEVLPPPTPEPVRAPQSATAIAAASQAEDQSTATATTAVSLSEEAAQLPGVERIEAPASATSQAGPDGQDESGDTVRVVRVQEIPVPTPRPVQ